MKTVKMISLLAALLMLIPAFVSCDKDDDPAEADAIIGTYSGSLAYSVAQYAPGTIDGTFEFQIKKDAKDADDVVVVIPECTFTPPLGPNARPFTIPALTVDDVDVSAKGQVYTIKEDSFSQTIDGKEYEGSNLTGIVTGKDITLTYQVIPGSMGMPITFTFTGTLK